MIALKIVHLLITCWLQVKHQLPNWEILALEMTQQVQDLLPVSVLKIKPKYTTITKLAFHFQS